VVTRAAGETTKGLRDRAADPALQRSGINGSIIIKASDLVDGNYDTARIRGVCQRDCCSTSKERECGENEGGGEVHIRQETRIVEEYLGCS